VEELQPSNIEESQETSSRLSLKKFLAIGTIALAVASGVLHFGRKLEAEPANAQPVAYTLEDDPTPIPVPSPTETPMPTATPESTPAITPTPTSTPVPTSTPLPIVTPFPTPGPSPEGNPATAQQIQDCRVQALGVIGGVGIRVAHNRKSIRWEVSTNKVQEECKPLGNWALKLALNKQLRRIVGPQYVKSRGEQVKVKAVTIKDPTEEHTYYKKVYLKRRFPEEGHAPGPDRITTLWQENGKETEKRKHISISELYYR
jgi:hypothetical protein